MVSSAWVEVNFNPFERISIFVVDRVLVERFLIFGFSWSLCSDVSDLGLKNVAYSFVGMSCLCSCMGLVRGGGGIAA